MDKKQYQILEKALKNKDYKAMNELMQSLKDLPTSKEEAVQHKYKFWNKEPVSQLKDHVKKSSEILTDDQLKKHSDNKFALPEGFEWDDKFEVDEVYSFLKKHYVASDDGEVMLYYSKDFIKWLLTNKDNHVFAGIRVTKTKKLAGFVSGKLLDFQLGMDKKKTCMVNFLCVHKKLRKKRMAAVLIQKITNISVSKGGYQGVFSSGKYFPTPFAELQYLHRILDYKHLVKVGFHRPDKSYDENVMIKTLSITFPKNNRIVPLEEKHIEAAIECLTKYQNKFSIYPIFSKKQFKHQFLENPIVHPFVVLNKKMDKVVDFMSYYDLDTIMRKETIKAAYLYYYSANEVSLYDLLKEMLRMTSNEGYHLFNMLDLMGNKEQEHSLMFLPGSGKLNYNLYNYKMVALKKKQIGLVFF